MLSSAVLFVLVLLPGTVYAYSGTGTVNCSGYLNLRQSPSTSASILDKLYPGTKISIEDSSSGWYKITFNGVSGWVFADYVSTDAPALPATPATSAVSNSVEVSKAQQIADYAQKFIGVRYVYGGESPNGFDCSGLAQYVFGNFGISLNRTASTQTSHGSVVERANLQVGDLVFFDTDGGHNSITHVGIYIGNDNFVHAESGGIRAVRISSLSEGYYSRNYMTARRVAY
jgi:N-acetylmuramoyl-L-alanine amidase